ncbi:MAG: superoxide dismutase [Flavobacterium sp.]|nr:superoxide dismutase [Flavobacterium sp.]
MQNKHTSRRGFITNTVKAGAALVVANTILPSLASAATNFSPTPFTQQPLPYGYKDLELAIDATTMEIHYTKHAATYAKNLSDALVAEKVDVAKVNLEGLMANISKYSPKMRNNGGGHYNHELFWQSMTSKSTMKPSGKLADAITKDFGSFEAFKTQFTDAGKNRFGSGWAWLVITNDKKLVVGSTPNQDNPLMDISDLKGTPLLGLDVWEHAYYLRYQNKRPDYINAWWNVVNWDIVTQRFQAV